jgi:hypothetical protein
MGHVLDRMGFPAISEMNSVAMAFRENGLDPLTPAMYEVQLFNDLTPPYDADTARIRTERISSFLRAIADKADQL